MWHGISPLQLLLPCLFYTFSGLIMCVMRKFQSCLFGVLYSSLLILNASMKLTEIMFSLNHRQNTSPHYMKSSGLSISFKNNWTHRSCPLPPIWSFLPYPSLIPLFAFFQYSKGDPFKTAAYDLVLAHTWIVSSICMISSCSILPFTG